MTRPAKPASKPAASHRRARRSSSTSPPSASLQTATETAPADDPGASEPSAPLRFKQSLLRMHPGERRGISLLIDPARIAPGTPVHVAVDPALGVNLWTDTVPEPVRGGWSRVSANLRCRVSADPGARLSVLAEAGGHLAELVVLVVRHRASGWVREIARKDEDAEIEAHFDPEAGTVTVFEGRREFKALERAARRAGLSKARVREYLPYRMLEVEVAANTVYAWAAEEILARRLAEERPPTRRVRGRRSPRGPGTALPRPREADAGVPRRRGLRRPRPHRARAPRARTAGNARCWRTERLAFRMLTADTGISSGDQCLRLSGFNALLVPSRGSSGDLSTAHAVVAFRKIRR